jgi:hypothetical protein
MKPIVLALALPVLLTGCAAYVGDAGPGYYDGGYVYGGPAVDVGFYSYDRGYYHHDYHHYDSGANRGAVAYRGASHVGATRVASASHVGGGHSGGSHHAAASASSGNFSGGGHR